MNVQKHMEQTSDLSENEKIDKRMGYLVHDIGPAIASFECIVNMLERGAFDAKKDSHQQLLINSKAAIVYAKFLSENILEYLYLSHPKKSVTPATSMKYVMWREFIQDCLSIPLILAQEKNINISYTVFNHDLKSWVNSSLTKRIVQNLVINSIKYCPHESSITVEVKQIDNNSIEIFVKDNGPGLPLFDLESIFEEAVQLSLRSLNEFYGVGIGLTFCKDATELLDGTISVENIIPHGLLFTLCLPTDFTDDPG